MCTLLACSKKADVPPPQAQATPAAATIVSVALRVHNMQRLETFYAEAFGVTFRSVRTGPFDSRFGELGDILIKLVPIRDSADFLNFPVHQLGVEVPDVARVINTAVRLGGRVQDSVATRGDSLVGSIRDPDGNTIELHQLLRRGN